MNFIRTMLLAGLLTMALTACGNDADDLGVGAACDTENLCQENDDFVLECLTGFKGGYCGLTGCTKNADCPESSICVKHEDNKNYCFRTCNDKAECNVNRDSTNESNCSSNITRIEDGNSKACVPPSN